MMQTPWTDQRTPALQIVSKGDQIHTLPNGLFQVKSQSNPDRAYLIAHQDEAWSCECDHYLHVGRHCIHVLATRYYLQVEQDTPDGVKTEKVRLTYSQAWSAYNAAQRQEIRLFDALLADLVAGIPEPHQEGMNGRPPLPLREQAFCAIQKVYSQLSSRRAAGLFDNAVDRDQLGHAPHYNAVSKFLLKQETTALLRGLIRESAKPLQGLEVDFAVDSTGFRTTCFGSYCQEKHGEKAKNIWLKAHICSGVRTNIVTDVIVTGSQGPGSADSPNFAPLIKATAAGFFINEVSADKAYSSRANHNVVGEVKGQAVIPFKSNATGRAGGSPLWRKAFHLFQACRPEFDARYHKRSNVESTIGAIKKKFGETLKSKNRIAQENELLCKVLAYNLTVLIHETYENGVPLNLTACPQTPLTAEV